MFPKEFAFCLFINYAYICSRTRRNFKETALQGITAMSTTSDVVVQLVDVLPLLRILRIEEASSVDMESNSKKLSRPVRICICFAKQRFCVK